MPDSKPDLYEILHIHPSAPPEVVRASYRQLALLYHPDKNPSPEATALMAQVNDAYAVLNDPEKRAAYDRERAAQARQATPPPDPDSQAGRNRPSTGYSSGTQTGYGTGVGFITLGSTKESVLRVEGTPSYTDVYPNLGEETWYFDSVTSITFGLLTGRVRAWRNPNSILRIRLVPGPNVTSYNFFEAGDHRDEVARLQGTPLFILVSEALNREVWGYQVGTVEFRFSTGRVVEWENWGGLKTRSSPRWEFFTSETNPRNIGISIEDPDNAAGLLVVRYFDRELEIMVSFGTELTYSDEMTVNYRIDNGPAWRQLWSTSTSRKGVFMPSFDVPETLRALMDAETFRVQVYPFGGSPLTASFQVGGFAIAISPVLEALRKSEQPRPKPAAPKWESQTPRQQQANPTPTTPASGEASDGAFSYLQEYKGVKPARPASRSTGASGCLLVLGAVAVGVAVLVLLGSF